MTPFLFPRWTNRAPAIIAAALGCLAVGVVAAFWYWGTDKYWRVGYSPEQPIPFSHKLHAGDLGMDCRYCHSTVERSAFSQVPPTQTCMNCHSKVKTDSPKLALLRERAADDKPIPWVRVHDLPDFVYFDHSAHVSQGLDCTNCHGRVDQMARVVQKAPLTMGWCLDCHRNPPSTKRPAQPPTHCSGCHR